MARSDKAATPATLDPTKSAAKPTSKAAGTAAPDWESIHAARDALIEARQVPHGTERELVRQFREMFDTGRHETLIPMTSADTVVYEQAFKYGRADIVVYHCDGTVSVIEAKNGAVGYSHVVAGIGQAGLYAMQIATKAVFKRVRRCLLWSSTGNLELDSLIDLACEQAGVVSLAMPSMAVMMATREAIRQAVEERNSGSA